MIHDSTGGRRREDQTVDRRSFLSVVGKSALAAAAAPALLGARTAAAKDVAGNAAESAVGQLFATLKPEQKKVIHFPYDHDLRQRISANWHVTKPKIGDDFYTKEQRELIDAIVRKLTSPDGYDRIQKQVEEDSGGMIDYSVALFGEPGSDKFEFELTGRHLTLRANGNRDDHVAFGGPIVYGHGEEESAKQNLFYYQTKQVNEVFGSLEGEQRKQALLTKAPRETEVTIKGSGKAYPGVAVGSLSSDQKLLVEKTLEVLFAPYRAEDIAEVKAILAATGGVEALHFAFYQQDDMQNDKVWDIWRVEGPSMVWHFRGAPHVHAYINIAAKS